MSEAQRFYRPDFSGAPDCPGRPDCTGRQRCRTFGLLGMCEWPVPIAMSNYTQPTWCPATDAGLAEGWLPRVPRETR